MLENTGTPTLSARFEDGGMKETQDVVDYGADHKVFPRIQVIKAEQANEAWENVVNKKAGYRYVIDAATF
jgi:alcohol dehydrogenase (NADP+)/uncharacterized zinc-type alcohol dehydrogenase-like protein